MYCDGSSGGSNGSVIIFENRSLMHVISGGGRGLPAGSAWPKRLSET